MPTFRPFRELKTASPRWSPLAPVGGLRLKTVGTRTVTLNPTPVTSPTPQPFDFLGYSLHHTRNQWLKTLAQGVGRVFRRLFGGYRRRLAVTGAAVALAGGMWWSPVAAQGDAVVVDDPRGAQIADNGLCSLTEAAITVQTGEAIYQSAGECQPTSQTIRLTSDVVLADDYDGYDSAFLVIQADLTLDGNDLSILQEDPDTQRRLFEVEASATVTFTDLTLQGGYAHNGGGAIRNRGDLTLDDVRFVDNRATYGGAVMNQGRLTVNDSLFDGNRTWGDYYSPGGAIYNGLDGVALVENTEFSDNRTTGDASRGGAIYNTGELSLMDSDLRGNYTEGTTSGGGAIFNSGWASIKDNRFSFNHTQGQSAEGGAVLNMRYDAAAVGTLYAADNLFERNYTAGDYSDGGAVYNGAYTVTLESTVYDARWIGDANTFAENGTRGYDADGGAIFNAGVLDSVNATYRDNYTDQPGTASDYETYLTQFPTAHYTQSDEPYSLSTQYSGYSDGGAIFNQGNALITDSVLTGNQSGGGGNGGGLYNAGTLTLINTRLDHNRARFAFGGGVFNNGTLRLANTQVLHNTGSHGGGLVNWGDATVQASIIRWNQARARSAAGGGVLNTGSLMLHHADLIENQASGLNAAGGGLFNAQGDVVAQDSTIVLNTASDHVSGSAGGGVVNAGVMTLRQTTVSGNQTTGPGSGVGGFVDVGGAVVFEGVTLNGNTSANDADDLYILGTLDITNSVIGSPQSGTIDCYIGGQARLSGEAITCAASQPPAQHQAPSAPGQPLQPEDLGVTELPRTGESPGPAARVRGILQETFGIDD